MASSVQLFLSLDQVWGLHPIEKTIETLFECQGPLKEIYPACST